MKLWEASGAAQADEIIEKPLRLAANGMAPTNKAKRKLGKNRVPTDFKVKRFFDFNRFHIYFTELKGPS